MKNRARFSLPEISWERLIREADGLLTELFPICRSITGDGVRKTLQRLREITKFDIKDVPSGTACYDWVVPEEWNIKDAFIKDSKGNKIVDFSTTNLCIVSYSIPVNKKVLFPELEKHLHYLPELPKAIPYRTSYYNRDWGFCLTYEQYQKLDREGEYHVFIDSVLKKGSLTYGESIIKGDSGKEYLISTYCCHPSLANDNLSGIILWTLLLRELKSIKTKHSYRFIIVPETIGAITYLYHNEEAMKRIDGGFVIATVAGPGKFGYKETFLKNHLIDRVAKKTFDELKIPYITYPFDINGSDEKQYSAPYFRIPVGTVCKDKYFEYDYYHTSLDDLDFISPANLVETLKLYLSIIEKLEINLTYKSLNPFSQPMLSKRSLYPKVGGHIKQKAVASKIHTSEKEDWFSNDDSIYRDELEAIAWLMFYSDGSTSILDISEKTKLPMKQLYHVAEKLKSYKLLTESDFSKREIR